MDALRACFVEPEGNVDKKRFQPASYLRKTFTIDKDVERADLYITACGMYKGFVNGTPVTSHVFMPGFTYYTKRLQYQVYDVTRLLVPGHNSICLILGDGWYRGKIGVSSRRHFYGDKTKISAVLDLSFTDGTRVPVATGGSWKATQDGPVRKSDWKDGEIYDARMELAGWHEPGYDDGSWHGVHPASYAGELVPSEGEPVLEHERFRPEVITTPDGATVLDFKQNLFGYVEFTVTGPWGHRVKLAHGETLDERGNFTLKNLTTEGTFFSRWKLLQEIDYTLKDGTQTYKPHFTCHGFRYVKVEHWPEPVKPENFASIAVYSDMAPAGSFECSDESINQLVRNTVWGLKSNFLDIPTDCPTRERAGWTGDISQFSLTASFLMDTRKFLAKWLKDVALQQHDDGRVASIVPDVGLPSFVDGAAGWADAAITVPHVLHAMYGDEGILRDQYACMTRWMDFLERRARKKHPARWLTRNPHRGSTIDAGFHWGEWLEPGHVMALDAIKGFLNPDFEVATACYGYSARLMAGIAAVLGKDGDAGKYRALHERVKAGYRYMYTGGGAVTLNIIQDESANNYDDIFEFMLTFMELHFEKGVILINTGFHWVTAQRLILEDDKRVPELFYLDPSTGSKPSKLTDFKSNIWFYIFQFDQDLRDRISDPVKRILNVKF